MAPKTDTIHNARNLLHRLELIAGMLQKKDFTLVSLEEMKQDVKEALFELEKHFNELIESNNDQ